MSKKLMLHYKKIFTKKWSILKKNRSERIWVVHYNKTFQLLMRLHYKFLPYIQYVVKSIGILEIKKSKSISIEENNPAFV